MADSSTVFDLGLCSLRPWRDGDQPALLRHASDWEVARWLRDRFPHPYTADDADEWVEYAGTVLKREVFAIDVAGEAVGSVGLVPGQDVFRHSAEVGYWLGRSAWGRGIAPLALQTLSSYAEQDLGFIRLFAGVFSGNQRSGRVLAKSGYHLEGVRRDAVVKAGQLLDEEVWVRLSAAPRPQIQGGDHPKNA